MTNGIQNFTQQTKANAMTEILKLSLNDFFTKKFLNFALVPLFLSFILLCVVAYFGFSALLGFFDELFGGDPAGSWLAFIYSFAFVQILIAILSYVCASFVVVFASVFFAIFIVSFLTPLICKQINDKYYRHERGKGVSNLTLIAKTLWILCKFALFFCVATLLLLVPFINLFIYNVVVYYLFHKLLLLDVASNTLSQDEFARFYAKSSPVEFKFATLCFYLLAFVPFAGLFLQVFFVIFLTHLFYQKVLNLVPKI